MEQLRRGDRVQHISGRQGVIIRIYNKRCNGGDLVEYAKVRMEGREVSTLEDHPTITLFKTR